MTGAPLTVTIEKVVEVEVVREVVRTKEVIQKQVKKVVSQVQYQTVVEKEFLANPGIQVEFVTGRGGTPPPMGAGPSGWAEADMVDAATAVLEASEGVGVSTLLGGRGGGRGAAGSGGPPSSSSPLASLSLRSPLAGAGGVSHLHSLGCT